MSTHRTHFKVAIILNIVVLSILAITSFICILTEFDFIPVLYFLIVGVLVIWLYRTESWIPALFMICFSLASSIPLFIIYSPLLEEAIGDIYGTAALNLGLGIPVYIYTFIIMLVFRKRFAADNVPLKDYRTKKGKRKSNSVEETEPQEEGSALKSTPKEKEPIIFKEKSAANSNSSNENSSNKSKNDEEYSLDEMYAKIDLEARKNKIFREELERRIRENGHTPTLDETMRLLEEREKEIEDAKQRIALLEIINNVDTSKQKSSDKTVESKNTVDNSISPDTETNEKPSNNTDTFDKVLDNLMLSQYAAWYVLQDSEAHKNQYLRILESLGFKEEEALKLLAFEGDIIKKYDKTYLLHPVYTKMWLFGLEKLCFEAYPFEKDDILKEHSLALSEICKTIDEAEWHYWNSHEDDIRDDVWEEIVQWHLKGVGGEFALKYFEMISEETGIPKEKILKYSTHEGTHLKTYKWRASDFEPLRKPAAEKMIAELKEIVIPAKKTVVEPSKEDITKSSTVIDDSVPKKENTIIRNNNNEHLKDIDTSFDWGSILEKSDSFKKSSNGLYTWVYRGRETATFYAKGKSFLAQNYPVPEEWADLLSDLTTILSTHYNTDCTIEIRAGLGAFKIGIMEVSTGRPSTSLIEGSDYKLDLSFSYISRGESLKEKLCLEDPKKKMTTDELTKIFETYLALPSIIYNSKRRTPLYNDFFNTINIGRAEMERNPDLLYQATKWTEKDLKKMLIKENEGLARILLVSLVFLTGAHAFVQDSEYRTSNQKEVPHCIALAIIGILLRTGQSRIPIHVNGNYDQLGDAVATVMDLLKNTPEIQGGAYVYLIDND